ncbi:MAG TPA: DUF2203 domain-containing protein [Polyangia bacterium]|nr:DUF2203 domain-containing protein [Polyangia bacterium]
MGEKRYFTIEEANSLIPALEIHFSKVMQLRAQLRVGYDQLEKLGAPPTVETLDLDSGPPDVQRARGRFRGLMEALTEELNAIEQTGVQVKDLDIGLCDFLGQREGREVWLCWQYGEKQVGFWHDLESGFAGRQPLENVEPPRRLLH